MNTKTCGCWVLGGLVGGIALLLTWCSTLERHDYRCIDRGFVKYHYDSYSDPCSARTTCVCERVD
ncbi:hypothetical protein [Allocoleopsis sp.]|uniref:hypothetical protein n=1 Tax=Allocoleopsis sp. TaxID=3088169 RepID=UPI002FCEF221